MYVPVALVSPLHAWPRRVTYAAHQPLLAAIAPLLASKDANLIIIMMDHDDHDDDDDDGDDDDDDDDDDTMMIVMMTTTQ
jgi:hypothetical protein